MLARGERKVVPLSIAKSRTTPSNNTFKVDYTSLAMIWCYINENDLTHIHRFQNVQGVST